jgi:pimeloyl-ACP methyl ester carboxylesterase
VFNDVANRTLVVFIHGFIDSDRLWGDLLEACRNCHELSHCEFKTYDYSQSTALVWPLISRGQNLARHVFKKIPEAKGVVPLEVLTADLLTRLSADWPQFKSVALVGHSTGGLIALNAILEERREAMKAGSIPRIRHLMQLAVPHKGAKIAKLARIIAPGNIQLNQLHRGSGFLRKLEIAWKAAQPSLAQGLGHEVIVAAKDEVIDASSACGYHGMKQYRSVQTTHSGICHPTNPDWTVFNLLRGLLQELTDNIEFDLRSNNQEESTENSRRPNFEHSVVEQTLDNLPNPPTSFVGRVDEREKLKKWLMEPLYQLVTLYAPGGYGKTRLALQLCHELKQSFPGTITLTNLAESREIAHLASVYAA